MKCAELKLLESLGGEFFELNIFFLQRVNLRVNLMAHAKTSKQLRIAHQCQLAGGNSHHSQWK